MRVYLLSGGPASGKLSGRPANRTVHIRKANISGLTILTDLRSKKVDDVLNGASPFSEVCWWFPELGVQFRISGRMEIFSSGTEREEIWKGLGPVQREWFASPTPGSAREKQKVDIDVSIVHGAMPAHFCICKIHVDFVDVFCQAPARREQFQKDETTDKWIHHCVYC